MIDWPRKKVADLIDGLTAGVSVRSTDGRGYGPAVLKTSAVDQGRFVPDEVKTIFPADRQRARCNPMAGSLIISRMNTPAMVGDVGYVRNDYPNLFLPDRLWLARSKRGSRTDMRWLTYLFASEPGAALLHGLASGTSMSMQSIPKDRVLELEIHTPPPVEQHAIGDALESTDDLIATLERLIAKKQAIKQGMMQQLLTGRTRLPGFTGKWTETRLGDILKFQAGFPFPSHQFSEESSGVRLVRNRDLRSDDATVFIRGHVPGDYVLDTGDVLIGMDGDFEPVIWQGGPAALNQRVGRLRFSSRSHAGFIAYAFVAPLKDLEYGTGATTVKHLSHSDVENLVMTIPSVAEQAAIAQVLIDSDVAIDALRLRLTKARAIKQGMMQQLLTGRTRLPVETAV